MGHRHIIYSSQMPEVEHAQIWKYPHSDPRLRFENSSQGIPVNVAVTRVNRTQHVDTGLSAMDYPPSSSSAELPNYGAANSEVSHDFYQHTSPAASSSRFAPNYIPHGPSFYNDLAISDESSSNNPHMDNGRAAFKRKRHAIPSVFESGQAYGYYGSASSSNLPISCDYLEQKPMRGPQCWPCGPVNMVPNYRIDNLSTAGEGFQRNVRSRHSHAVHFENSSASAYQPENLPHHVSSSGTGSFVHEINQSLAGNSVSHDTTGIDGAFCTNIIQNTTPSAPMMIPSVSGPSARGIGAGCSNYGQRTPVYRGCSSYPTGVFASTSSGNAVLSGVEAIASSRHCRPVSMVERSRERNGRVRNYSDRLQFVLNEENANSGWYSEGAPMIYDSTFYDSIDLFDHHRDMRLDIDNMSYEELLALGERIGNVGTGLSEDTISRCLMETSYSSNWIQDDQEEDKCVICLEEYKDRERLGRLKCGHDFHVSCIRKWLLIKNVCPICKAAALSATSKEKQIVSS